MRFFIKSFFLVLLLSMITQGCHYKDDDDDDDDYRRRKRQVLTEVEQTERLRGFFASCLKNKLGNLIDSWDSALDFTVLDSRWYQNSDAELCSAAFGADSKECWIERLSEFVNSDSPLSRPSEQCIEEFNALFERNYPADRTCEQGGWTPFFDIESDKENNYKNPSLSDFQEIFPGAICENPTLIEAQYINGNEVISKNRIKRFSNGTFRCPNKFRRVGDSCKDFTFRFCCPLTREVYGKCESTRWTKFFNTDRNTTDEGDYENILEARMQEDGESICPFPTAIDVRQNDDKDYRLAEQVVSLSLNEGFHCRNADQPGNTKCRDYKVRYCCPTIQTSTSFQRTKRQTIFSPNGQLVADYEGCISSTVALPSYRRPLDYNTLAALAEEYLLCDLSELGDCFSNITAEFPEALEAWPYRLEGLCREGSPLTDTLARCNGLVFPLEEILQGWGRWSPWDNCPARCGETGIQLRRRQCLSGPPGVAPCIGSVHQMRQCQPENCPLFTDWTDWSSCPSNQPNSRRRRTRICVNGAPGSTGCSGETVEEESCGGCTGESCIDTDLSQWSTWDPCPARCGTTGVTRRRRHCTTGITQRCQGLKEQMQECQAENCPSWSDWEQWTNTCPDTCTISQRTRRRRCFLRGNPHHACQGAATSTEACELPPGCRSGDTFLSQWSDYDPCPTQCGHTAFHTRRRHCTNGPNGGPGCTAHLEERKECRADDCPQWGNWQPWSTCSGRCGRSFRTRRRQCLLRAIPHHNCQGASEEAESCFHPRCGSGDEFLSQWTNYEPCPAQCGGTAFHNRRRHCTNGPNGGPGCSAPLVEEKQCVRRCARWSEWTQFDSCPVSCGSSTQARTRHCIDGNIGDEGCSGVHRETRPCNVPCINVVNSEEGFSEWSSWGFCRAQCGGNSQRIRRRHCQTGALGSPGCVGNQIETEQCTRMCGTWSQWTNFNACVAPCGHSSISRRRTCIGGVVGQEACYGLAFESRRCYTGRRCV